jgi:hypothetical protein
MNILHTIKGRKAYCIGHILHRNCLIKQVTEGKIEGMIEGTGKRERRPKQIMGKTQENERILETERSNIRSQSI